MSNNLDATRLADLARDPHRHGDAATVAHAALRAAQAERAVLIIAGQAINAAMRPCFDREYGVYPGLCGDLRGEADEPMTHDEALSDATDRATDEVLSYAESVADWLAQACNTDAGRMPLDVSALTDMQVIEGSAATLLAVIMTGDNKQAIRARHRLREMAAKDYQIDINMRAAELMAVAS